MKELANRCEKATGPDRELDARITYAKSPLMSRLGTVEDYLRTSQSQGCLAYTASLDAAMMLVPEGWEWGRRVGADGTFMECYPPGHLAAVGFKGAWGDFRAYSAVVDDNDALALTAAALRARAAIGDRNGNRQDREDGLGPKDEGPGAL